jgi:hypothetical protein
MALESLLHATSPPLVVNLAGPDILKVREVCRSLGECLSKTPQFIGAEAPDALLSDGSRGYERSANDPLDRRLGAQRRRDAFQTDAFPKPRR